MLPPEPRQFHAKCVMAPLAPLRPAPEPVQKSGEDVEEDCRELQAELYHHGHLEPELERWACVQGTDAR